MYKDGCFVVCKYNETCGNVENCLYCLLVNCKAGNFNNWDFIISELEKLSESEWQSDKDACIKYIKWIYDGEYDGKYTLTPEQDDAFDKIYTTAQTPAKETV